MPHPRFPEFASKSHSACRWYMTEMMIGLLLFLRETDIWTLIFLSFKYSLKHVLEFGWSKEAAVWARESE